MGDKKKKKDRKRRHSSESDSDDKKRKKRKHHSDSSDSEDHKKRHKHKKKKKKHKKHKSESREESKVAGPSVETATKETVEEAPKRMMKPMTKEEWEKQQSVVRKVYDPDTGRTRLVKGDGEILEEIVSRERQKEINKQATAGDGASFQRAVGLIK